MDQYQVCGICRWNHNDGERHLYSKSHKTSLEKMLTRFSTKMELARSALKTTTIIQSNLEETFWCYICGEECQKHHMLTDCAGEYGGLAQHFSSASHKHQLDIFARLHRIDRQKLEKFRLKEQMYVKYTEEVEIARCVHIERFRERLNEEANRVATAEQENRQIAAAGQRRRYVQIQEPGHSASSTADLLSGPSTMISRTGQAVRTIDARGDGLTCIKIPDDEASDGSGNVHSGALPPWLQTMPAPSTVIGPTLDDYQQQQRLERRSKLPVARVGANFSRQAPTTSAWLPSFGQVWSKKRAKQRDRVCNNGKKEVLRPKPCKAPLPPLKRMKFDRQ